MKTIDLHSNYMPESGIIYYSCTMRLLLWEGYFDCIFKAICDTTSFENYPIEFKDYNDFVGWRDDDTLSRQINVPATLDSLHAIDIKKLELIDFSIYEEIIGFFEFIKSEDVYIKIYW